MHLPLIHRRTAGAPRAVADRSSALTGREAFLELLQEREQMARERLSAATGHQSLCRVPAATPGPDRSVKHHEGAAIALADVRRAVRSAADGDIRSAVDAVRTSWLAQAGLPGRSGPAWADYLEGGLDALSRLEEEDVP